MKKLTKINKNVELSTSRDLGCSSCRYFCGGNSIAYEHTGSLTQDTSSSGLRPD